MSKREDAERRAAEFLASVGLGGVDLAATPLGERVAHRFWSKVIDQDGHWWWTGYVDPRGHGLFSVRAGQTLTAPRAAWLTINGPTDALVMHRPTCSVRLCVKLDHLYTGTLADAGRRGGEGSTGRRKPEKTLAPHADVAVSEAMARVVRKAHRQGAPVPTICRATGLGPEAVVRLLGGPGDGHAR